MKKSGLYKVILAAMFAALTAGLTMFPKIPIPGGGYVHLGDAMIYLASSFLPLPYAMAAAGIGGGLADILSGFASYAPFTVVVKVLLTIAFTSKNKNVILGFKRNFLAPLAGLIITPGIYFLADALLAKSFAAAAPGIIWNVAQAAASLALYYVIAIAFDTAGLKKKLMAKFHV